jgi:hypothetical protein
VIFQRQLPGLGSDVLGDCEFFFKRHKGKVAQGGLWPQPKSWRGR